MKTAISLPDPLFSEADRLAKRLRISRSELYRRAIERYLRDHEAAVVTDRLNLVYGPGAESGAVDRDLEELQDEALSDEEDW